MRRRLVPSGLALLMTVSFAARAQDRGFVDLEPGTPRFGSGGDTRVSIWTMGATFGWGTGTVIPYVGGGLGFVIAQARAGVSLIPRGLASAGPVIRLEARPAVFLAPCLEPALLGSVGVGYRWPLEPSYPDARAGTAFYLVPAFEGGEAWLRPHCNSAMPPEPREPKVLLGGTVALGFDW